MGHSARKEIFKFLDEEPTVVIFGRGQCGPSVTARLKTLGIGALVVELNQRIGDNWRHRHSALCLHDPGHTTRAGMHWTV